MKKRCFELSDGTTNKFWSIALRGAKYTVVYGKIGSKGQSRTKEFGSSKAAKDECEKKISEKLRKGYIEHSAKPGDFEPIYLVSDKISPVDPKDIDTLERRIGSLPNGYREFICRCGGNGDLFDDIHVWPPNVILDNVSSSREHMTFSNCMDGVNDPKGLKEQDFEDIWIIGSDGNGNNYCYFPRHQGVLFNLMHCGMEVVKHEQAFREVSRLWCDGRVRHPFPYFAPNDGKSKRYLKSFSLITSKSPQDFADILVDYWREQDIEIIVIRMPPQHDEDDSDSHIVFVPSLGGQIDFGRDERNHPAELFGNFSSDKEHRTLMQRCVKAVT